MNLAEQLMADMKAAMRAKEQTRLRTIRSLRAALKEKEIAQREGGTATLSEQDMLSVVQKQAKQRRDAIDQYDQAGRDDLAQVERDELAIIETYLPKQLTDEEIRTAVEAIIAQTGASSMKDMGKVMGPSMQALQGRADGKRVQAIVRSFLAG
ncbi:MAG: GatB/YqeY domain-containing protein [Bacteroidota bacterium]